MSPFHGFRTRLEGQAYGLGFDLVGVTSLGVPDSVAHFDAWLEAGYHADMEYMARGAQLRRDARRPHPGATHAIVVGMHYGGGAPSGPVARYARGDDYHELMRERLRGLHSWLLEELGVEIDARPYVDSGPLLERDLAQRAGIGWIGKNSCVINPKQGSWFFIGALVVNVVLPIDAPFASDHCGSCTRCLDACPTDALVAPRVLDANRCISYLTIENRGEIAEELQPLIGELLYGCDICQEVCPWNVSFATALKEPAFAARDVIASKDAGTLSRDILALDDEAFLAAFKHSPMKRAKLRGLKRNAAAVLGNIGLPEDVATLISALTNDEPLVRGHAAWALGRIGTLSAVPALNAQRSCEADDWVLSALSSAVAEIFAKSSLS